MIHGFFSHPKFPEYLKSLFSSQNTGWKKSNCSHFTDREMRHFGSLWQNREI